MQIRCPYILQLATICLESQIGFQLHELLCKASKFDLMTKMEHEILIYKMPSRLSLEPNKQCILYSFHEAKLC